MCDNRLKFSNSYSPVFLMRADQILESHLIMHTKILISNCEHDEKNKKDDKKREIDRIRKRGKGKKR